MFRALTAVPQSELTKWCAYAVALLLPGSLIVLPALWLVRRFSSARQA